MIAERLFEPILDVVYATMPRDNLLNSACLEFFDFIKRESVKPLIHHLVENYREKLETMGYVETFSGLVVKYDQMPPGFPGNMETSFLDTEEDTPQRPRLGNRRWDGVKDLDPAEEEYFNTSDDEEEQSKNSYTGRLAATPEKARSRKPLVDYPSDEEAEMLDAEADSEKAEEVARDEGTSDKEESGVTLAFKSAPPPERLSEKRRREEDEEDELEKLVQQHTKRRNSTSSNSSTGSATSNASLRKKKSFSNAKEGGVGAPRRMHISITPAIKSGGGDGGKASGDGS
jgi:protein phosphatase-4 regulatory subunit 3